MLTIHHLHHSRSQRVVWLAEELGIAYTIVPYERDPQTFRAPAALREIHMLGKAPVVEVEGLKLTESGAIVEFLIDRYGKGNLAPERNSKDYASYLMWLHYAEGSAMMPILAFMLGHGTKVRSDAYFGAVQAELSLQLGFIGERLASTPYVVGSEFTGADINLAFVLELAEAFGLLQTIPKLTEYLTRLRQRPAYHRALEKGAPYNLKVFAGG